jgi:ABC-type bacteriocin/lantibiotic exporter with double-glycine peptidase domain
MAMRGAASLGAVVGFYSLAGVCLAPVSQLAAGAYRFRSTAEYLRRAYEVLSARPEAAGPAAGARPVTDLAGGIELAGVSFRYSASADPVLEEIDLAIRPGETIVIVGKTGSGKSTLAKILATLYDPTSGDVRVDGVAVAGYDRAALRARFGAVFQENVLVGGSILDNVTLGRDLPIARVYRCLALACLLDDVKQMPLGLATPVGAGGLHLSGGQRQRLCLARALASEPRLLLLDEGTSAVDRHTERRIYRRIARLRCTKIIVTHRLYVAETAERVVVLDRGRVAQIGRHADLCRVPGPYADLWRDGGAELEPRVEEAPPPGAEPPRG